jgi:cytochrome b subunit of formate dehydrogenase
VKSKATVNYWIDVVIAVAFVLSAVSGIVLYFAPSGFQGGRNAFYGKDILFLTTHAWGELHTWGSLAMIAGVFAHLVLHWNWMVCMTKKLFRRRRVVETTQIEIAPQCESASAL